jgi:8-oxo-dGTP pyrophosphatase MutT (NUDIX family)
MSVDAKTEAWAAEQPKKLVASKVILKSTKGDILLVKPNYKPTWQFPGGGVDAGESPEDAALREIKEELGLELSREDLKLVGLVYRQDLDNLFPMFESQVLLDEKRQLKLQVSELDEYRYVPPEDVMPQISSYYAEFWQNYLKPSDE